MENHVDPQRAAFEYFKTLPRDTPIEMLNLIRFKDRASYPDGHNQSGKELSGLDAYKLYGKESGPIFERVGGSIIWRGHMQALVIGPSDEHWDACFIARYPNSAAFLEMVTDPAYQIAVVNRQSAVQTSRLIRMNPVAISGNKFS